MPIANQYNIYINVSSIIHYLSINHLYISSVTFYKNFLKLYIIALIIQCQK